MKVLPFAIAAGLLAAAATSQAQQASNASAFQVRGEPKLVLTMQQTPTFNVSGPKDKRVTPLEWLEIEVEMDVQVAPANKAGFIDEITGDFYVVVEDVSTGKPVMLNDKITFIDVNARDKKAWLVGYVAPATLAKFLNKEKPSTNDIKMAAVVITGPGMVAPKKDEDVAAVMSGSAKDFWKSASVAKKAGMVLPKSKTVFAPLWGDRHPHTKD